MSKPLYRARRLAHPETGKCYTAVSVDIPDVLEPGDSIHIQFPLPDSVTQGRSNLTGGGFWKVADDGRLEFDGT